MQLGTVLIKKYLNEKEFVIKPPSDCSACSEVPYQLSVSRQMQVRARLIALWNSLPSK